MNRIYILCAGSAFFLPVVDCISAPITSLQQEISSFKEKREEKRLKKEKTRYEVVSPTSGKPGYPTIQDAIEAARAEGASSLYPAVIAIEEGSYEEDLTLYDGIEIEGPDGEFLDLENPENPLVQIVGIHTWPQEGAVHLKNLTFQIDPSGMGSNFGFQKNKDHDPKSLIPATTDRTNPALTNSGGGSSIVANPHSVLIGTTGNSIASLPVAGNGQILIGSNGADPVWAVPTDTPTLVWTAGPGTLRADVVGGTGGISAVVGVSPINVTTSIGGTATVSFSSSYAGQTSITTLGTIGTGTWQGTLISPTFGGTGVNNGSNTVTWSNGSATFDFNGGTNVTFPTLGMLATTSQIPTLPVSVANGGTGATSLTAHGVVIGEGTSPVSVTSVGMNGQLLIGATSADPAFATVAGTQGVTFATGANSLSIGLMNVPNSALANSSITLSNGTNITVTGSTVLGGTATIGVSGQISPGNGGTGVNNGSNTVTWSNGSATFDFNGGTNVTFPTLGMLATTSQLPTLPVTVPNGGTGVSTLTAHGVLLGEGTSNVAATSAGTSGQLLQSGGASADPAWTTATYPSSAASSGSVIRANGSNFLESTSSWPDTVTQYGILYADLTNHVGQLAVNPNGALITNSSGVPTLLTALNTGQILQSNSSTGPVWSTASYPSTTTANQILYSSSSNTVAGLTSGNNLLAATDSSGNLAMRAFSLNIQTFSSTGTYTPTSGMVYCLVRMVGSGGGGGGVASTTSSQLSTSSGGGAGEYAEGVFSYSTIVGSGTKASVTIGTAGSGGSAGANNGSSGNTTSLTANNGSGTLLLSAAGGGGGIGGSATGTGISTLGGAGGSGGTGSGTVIHTPGAVGGYCFNAFASSILIGGNGGSSLFGPGGAPAQGAANNGVSPGSGGSGAANSTSGSARAGGNGAAGYVEIIEFIIN